MASTGGSAAKYFPVPTEEMSGDKTDDWLDTVFTGQQSPDFEKSTGTSCAERRRLAQKGLAKLLFEMHQVEELQVEKRSVYGSAIAIPQIARSAGWPWSFTLLAMRAYLFLAVNILLQGFFLYMIACQNEVLNKYAGQPFLCNFGANADNCPGSTGCMGPGGTEFNMENLYDFDSWTTRVFVRESLMKMFPERADEIMQKVRPGEYGQESQACRIVCCFLFIASLVPDLSAIYEMGRLLWILPSADESWVVYDGMSGSEPAVRIRGMPLFWKVLNVVFLLIPKIFLWKLTASAGMDFLMDTSNIVDVIVNTVALDFVLSIDEMLFATVTALDTREIMDNLQGYDNVVISANSDEEKDEQIRQQLEQNNTFSILAAIPLRLFQVVVISCFFVTEYYFTDCQLSDDGSWVSKNVYMPASSHYPISTFLFPYWFEMPLASDEPLWSMDTEMDKLQRMDYRFDDVTG